MAKITITKNDLEIKACRGSGPGGQHRNKTSSAIIIKHPASGAQVRCEEHKSQHQNKKEALKMLAEHKLFKSWSYSKLIEQEKGLTVKEFVDQMMDPKYLKYEIKKNGKWVPEI